MNSGSFQNVNLRINSRLVEIVELYSRGYIRRLRVSVAANLELPRVTNDSVFTEGVAFLHGAECPGEATHPAYYILMHYWLIHLWVIGSRFCSALTVLDMYIE